MKLRILLSAFFAFSVLSASARLHPLPTRTSTSNMIMFGNVTKGCSGKGACNVAAVGAPSPYIPVTFTLIDEYTVELSFKMADLHTNQPDQEQYFQGSSYVFETAFPLSDQSFAVFNLAQGATIDVTSPNTVHQADGVVYVTATITYGN